MLVLDYRRSLDLMSGTQSGRVVERGANRLAVEDHVALAFDHATSMTLALALGNPLPVMRPVAGDHSQCGHPQADEGRLELFGGDAVLAKVSAMKIRPDLVERRPDAVRDWRQHLVALSHVAHLRGALEPYRAERHAFARQQCAAVLFQRPITLLERLRVSLGERRIEEALEIVPQVHLRRAVCGSDARVRGHDHSGDAERARDPAGMHRAGAAGTGERKIARIAPALGQR